MKNQPICYVNLILCCTCINNTIMIVLCMHSYNYDHYEYITLKRYKKHDPGICVFGTVKSEYLRTFIS